MSEKPLHDTQRDLLSSEDTLPVAADLQQSTVSTVAHHMQTMLARRLRPQCFGDLIGQDITVRLLQKAFASDHLPGAMVFSGIRGVGKTTLARLVARRLNCQAPRQDVHVEWGEISEACGRCDSCVSMAEERHTDIIEMDAASHTSVDDVRKILEACQYRPLLGRYKIFIVDEVHMLSKSAFNAFLKTLEAPPSHVMFLFATTEPRKIPLTILSRCLRFQLQRVPEETLQTYLLDVCKKEGYNAEESALSLLAEAAEGSVRDALSLLDQVLLLLREGAEEKFLTASLVRLALGLQEQEVVTQLLIHCVHRQSEEALTLFRRAYSGGGDPLLLMDQMLGAVHAWATGRVQPPQELTRDLLGRFWQMLLKGRSEIQGAPWPDKVFEMFLLRLIYATQLPSLDHIMQMQKNVFAGKRVATAPVEKESASKECSRHVENSLPSETYKPTQDKSEKLTVYVPLIKAAHAHFPDLKISGIEKENAIATKEEEQ